MGRYLLLYGKGNGNARTPLAARGQRVVVAAKRPLRGPGSEGVRQFGVYSIVR